ncbi:MAG TPA: T9SS type A sorting domain-containing protein [Bacteroidota bacterium]|nr:T9SS type A sorting domain-containing protein [Bacteroidota bacterium]
MSDRLRPHYGVALLAGLMIALTLPVAGVGQSPGQIPSGLAAGEGNAIGRAPGIIADEAGSAPKTFALSQNYPNPFNPSTKIQYNIEKAGMVSLKVYNLLGLEIATLVNARQEAGIHTVPFNTNEGTLNLGSGIYFYRLEAAQLHSIKKLVIIK